MKLDRIQLRHLLAMERRRSREVEGVGLFLSHPAATRPSHRKVELLHIRTCFQYALDQGHIMRVMAFTIPNADSQQRSFSWRSAYHNMVTGTQLCLLSYRLTIGRHRILMFVRKRSWPSPWSVIQYVPHRTSAVILPTGLMMLMWEFRRGS